MTTVESPSGAESTFVLPINLEAEEAVLGAMLSNPNAVPVVVKLLSRADFWRPQHGPLFEAIARLYRAGQEPDTITVAAELERRQHGEKTELDFVGGAARLHVLAEACPAVTNAADYAAIVADSAHRRRVAQAASRVHEASSSGAGLHEALAELAELAAGTTPGITGNQGQFIDWSEFWGRDHSAEDWVYPDVLARGRGHSIYAEHKAGKSLLMLWIAARLATGSDPVAVTYLDYEMSLEDLHDRLEDMGYGPESDLSRLHYALLPSLPPLDTAAGAVALTATVDSVGRAWPGHHQLVIIDTISRAVCGEENSADTIRDFYAHTGIQLKRRGATWVRLDHAGKDPGQGQRGTSGKGDDVDVVWRLSRTEHGILLHRELSRMNWVTENVHFGVYESPLRYHRQDRDWPVGTEETAADLDALRVPIETKTREAQKALKEAGRGRRRDIVVAAIAWRKRHDYQVEF